MNGHDSWNDARRNDEELRLQMEAERAEREHAPAARDPRVDRYRLVVRALRQPLDPLLPADFAARIAELAEHGPGNDGFEDWLVVLLMLGMGMGGLMFVGPMLIQALHAIVDIAPSNLPWHQLVLGALGVGIVAAIERGWMRVHPGARQPR